MTLAKEMTKRKTWPPPWPRAYSLVAEMGGQELLDRLENMDNPPPCESCGKHIVATDKFCKECGEPIQKEKNGMHTLMKAEIRLRLTAEITRCHEQV